jgi:hypothetical protein
MANDENRDSKDKEIERQTAIMVKLAEDLRRKETETARLQVRRVIGRRG